MVSGKKILEGVSSGHEVSLDTWLRCTVILNAQWWLLFPVSHNFLGLLSIPPISSDRDKENSALTSGPFESLLPPSSSADPYPFFSPPQTNKKTARCVFISVWTKKRASACFDDVEHGRRGDGGYPFLFVRRT